MIRHTMLGSILGAFLFCLFSFNANAGLPGAMAMSHGVGGAGAVALLDPFDPASSEGRVRVSGDDNHQHDGDTRPAWCDVDGDGADELVVGLGPGSGGWIEILDDESHSHAHLRWLRIPWKKYNDANGETMPACGDLDDDGLDELVIGLGDGSRGWFLLLDDALHGYKKIAGTSHTNGWKRYSGKKYNRSGGGVRPAVGNLDQDSADEIVIASGPGGKGWVEVFDDAQASFAHLDWKRPGHLKYQRNDEGIWPAICDLDGDGASELLLGMGQGGGGWLRVFDSADALHTKSATGLRRGWLRLGWRGYNQRSGAVMPACANMDDDPSDELVLSLSARDGAGWYEVRDDLTTGMEHKAWNRITLPVTTATDTQQKPGMIHLAMRPQGQSGPGFALAQVASGEALKDFLTQGLLDSATPQMYDRLYMATAMEADASSDAGSGATVSSTNLQEVGVDEADRIKSDGHYLYLISDQSITDNSVESDVAVSSFVAPFHYTKKHLRVLRVRDDPASVTEVDEIAFESDEQVDGLYLANNRPEDAADMLVTVGGRNSNMWAMWLSPWYWRSGDTEIGFYDVSDPTAIERNTHIKINGQLISSRRIGEKLYLVTRYTPSPRDFNYYPVTDSEKQDNQTLTEQITVSDLLPDISINGIDHGDLVEPENCFVPSFSEKRAITPDLITLVTIDLAQPDQWLAHCVVGPTETIYVSTESLYLATTRVNYAAPRIRPIGRFDALMEPVEMVETTAIHKFSLTEEGPLYRGSGTVRGTLGWEQDKKPFRMSEYDNTLRIATSLGQTWNDTATTRLTLLQEKTSDLSTVLPSLEETAHVDGIGALGERLYSVRYVGSRAYLVTFKVTDPLYVFDLADPFNPVQRGALHIEGYSDYLHPIGETLLLGIGKTAVADTDASDMGGRGAWYQGLKLTLFDVADPDNPSELESHVIGQRGTDSGILSDHHAMAWLPPMDGKPGRLAIPVKRHDTEPTHAWADLGQPWTWYDWTDTGLHLFDIYSDGASSLQERIDPIGQITISSRDNGDTDGGYWYFAQDRALLLNDSVHYIHGGQVWSGIWGDNKEGIVGPQ
ncbi:MAG: beta-propeller domain-containing protein [Magnetococcales bacterium]|nr:beta-propeller domain-containing protein [Magnetococcales bacterium]